METKKVSKNRSSNRSSNRSTKKVEETEYNATIALKRARTSGIAIKTETVRNNGTYSVKPSKNGTSTVLNGIFKAYFPNKKEVESGIFKEVLISLFSGKDKDKDKIVSGFISSYESETGREYKNFGTLKSRLKTEIERGNILSFKLVTEPER